MAFEDASRLLFIFDPVQLGHASVIPLATYPDEAHKSLRPATYTKSFCVFSGLSGGGGDGSIVTFNDIETAFHAAVESIILIDLATSSIDLGDFVQFTYWLSSCPSLCYFTIIQLHKK